MNTTTATTTFTVEALEHLATELEGREQEQRQRLSRLCAAYVRIIAARAPEKFTPRATHHGDEAGHWDTSYPPKQEYSATTGPALIQVEERETEDVATEGGFYYPWRRVTTYGGLYVDMHGRWWRSDETGTGRYGQFAAHPGDCDVDCEIDWSTVDADDVTLAELGHAEAKLRKIAFPLATAAQKG